MKTTTLYPLLAVLAMMVITPALDVNAMPQPTPQMPGTGNGNDNRPSPGTFNGAVARLPPGTLNGAVARPPPDTESGTVNGPLPGSSNDHVARPSPGTFNGAGNGSPPGTGNGVARPPPVTDDSPLPDLSSGTDTFADVPDQGTNGSNASVNKHDSDSIYEGTRKYPTGNGNLGPHDPVPMIYRYKPTDRPSGSLDDRVAALEAEVQALRTTMALGPHRAPNGSGSGSGYGYNPHNPFGPSSGTFNKIDGDIPSFASLDNGKLPITDPNSKHVVPARPYGGPIPQPKPAGNPYDLFKDSVKSEPGADSSGEDFSDNFTTTSGVRVNVKPAGNDPTPKPRPNPQASNGETGGRRNPPTSNLPGPTPNPGTQESPIF